MTIAQPTRTAGIDHFTTVQLLRAARLFATDPELPELVALSSPEREWHRLAETPYLQIWLLAWPAGSSTDWHDHGRASGAFVTVAGELSEQSWLGAVHERVIPTGEGRGFGRRHIHNVSNRADTVALSVHAYSPALTEMTRYALVDDRIEITNVDRAGEQW